MIKHHPNDEILAQFVSAELPASVSVAVAIHVEMCDCCQQKVSKLTELAAELSLQEPVCHKQEADLDFDAMFDQIVQDESLESCRIDNTARLNFGDQHILLPKALRQLELSDWSGLGKINRSRVKLDDNSNRSSLLHIEAGGEIPAHTHTGQELTLLLQGSFKDEMGEYHEGDFIWLNREHQHQPVSEQGCLCYTVVTDPLHFTQGLSRLLNPIGKLIY